MVSRYWTICNRFDRNRVSCLTFSLYDNFWSFGAAQFLNNLVHPLWPPVSRQSHRGTVIVVVTKSSSVMANELYKLKLIKLKREWTVGGTNARHQSLLALNFNLEQQKQDIFLPTKKLTKYPTKKKTSFLPTKCHRFTACPCFRVGKLWHQTSNKFRISGPGSGATTTTTTTLATKLLRKRAEKGEKLYFFFLSRKSLQWMGLNFFLNRKQNCAFRLA